VQLRTLLAKGQALTPLFCVPLLVKDNYDTVGMAATAGSVGLLDNFATENAFVVSGPSYSLCLKAVLQCCHVERVILES
jgi:hypothetical protein